ncbi:hypothetical protein E5083_01985 [Streptomyces bauhiniae]|uniref:Alpha/beta hydrolase n=1 Tax=Streptomyces bauhiniae TaxID=2340725 RepID=A0A4Z1DER3_9ACTN|nr:hypothetical protein [Streptomyces bauhiniae]TGN81314.1 hypothetical protein E5083_01985 [Streptomyces bauhiniae]
MNGYEIITLTSKRGATSTEVIYLHGGAYVRTLVAAHWRIVAALIRHTGATDHPVLRPRTPVHRLRLLSDRIQAG